MPLGLVAFVASWWGTAYLRAWAKLEIVAAGEPLWFSELDVLPQPDVIDLLLQAEKAMVKPPDEDRTIVNTYIRPDDALNPEHLPALRRHVEANQAMATETLHRDERLDSPTPLWEGVRSLISPVMAVRRLYHCRYRVALMEGNNADALERLHDQWNVANLPASNDPVMDRVWKLAIVASTVRELQRLLAVDDLSNVAFKRLDQRLTTEQRRERTRPIALATRAAIHTSFVNVDAKKLLELVETVERMSPGSILDVLLGRNRPPEPPTVADRVRSLKLRLMPTVLGEPILMEGLAETLRLNTEVVGLMDEVGPEARERAQELRRQIETSSKTTPFPLVYDILNGLMTTRLGSLRVRQRLALARLGIRVDRYRATHGKLPERLDQVLDDNLEELPVCLFTGKPLIYRPTESGFTIHNPGKEGSETGEPKEDFTVAVFKIEY
ncbi:hypothetical protein Pan216_55300 [Planctomycetes bacterium Pan216]|uniref:Uncharacterized protein n=1 Tax=Kolteria novifilia TaxID=2527975 RepID=A0A518BCE4_9BACT|nr:hypothetical protein Pan216_55300 [Planctomycetes bacterium Pan216]